MTKKCNRCSLIKDLSDYYKAKDTKDKLRPICKSCSYSQGRTWYLSNKIHSQINQFTYKTDIKITIEEYNILLTNQKGLCALCNSLPGGKALHIDPCHKTNKIRGLLCGSCNRALGLLKDNEQVLQKAIDYVKSNK